MRNITRLTIKGNTTRTVFDKIQKYCGKVLRLTSIVTKVEMDIHEDRDLTEEEFVGNVLIGIAEETKAASHALNESDGMETFEVHSDVYDDNTNCKRKRRSNLTEFTNEQTTKRKNECAKRELTSVVNQVK